MPRGLRVATVMLVLGWGCRSSVVNMPDATRYQARDAVIDPRPDADLDVASLEDSSPVVDVVPFDGARAVNASADVTLDVPITCQDIANRYVENIQAAQMCAAASDCDTLACETPCCACQVYVQAGTAPYLRLDALRTQWRAMDCPMFVSCPTTQCTDPVSVACSSIGRCVTLRAIGDGGL